MAVANEFNAANQIFKVKYADKMAELVPEFALLQKLRPFQPSKKVGASYEQAIQLSTENGFTYLGQTGGYTALNNPSAGVVKMAQVIPSQLQLVSYMTDIAITRSQGDESAFVRETKWKVRDMNESTRRRIEVASLYGQDNLGVVESVTLNSGNTDVVLTAGTWAGGIWTGAEGALLDTWTGGTQHNVAALEILSVDSDTRTLKLVGNQTAVVSIADTLNYRGARTGTSTYNEMAGLKKIITNNGTLFAIDASQFSLWKGNVDLAVGPISFEKLQMLVAKAVNKGLSEKLVVLVSPKAWGKLLNDQSSLRVYESAGSTFINGAEALKFHSQNGVLEIYSHPCVKDGDCFLVPPEYLSRLGSVDISFALPGQDGVYFDRVPGYAAVQLRCMTDQAIFLEKPAHAVFGSGIT